MVGHKPPHSICMIIVCILLSFNVIVYFHLKKKFPCYFYNQSYLILRANPLPSQTALFRLKLKF